jgi:hypothetical protein
MSRTRRRMNFGRPQIDLIGAASALVSMDIELWDATIATSLDTHSIHSSSIITLAHLDQRSHATTSTPSVSGCDKLSDTWCNRSTDQLQELKAEWCLSRMTTQ